MNTQKRYRLIFGKGTVFGKNAETPEFYDTREQAYDVLKADESKWTWYELATRQDDDGSWRSVDHLKPE